MSFFISFVGRKNMNKKLLAMAVAGVMAAPMAAQADVTVYGKFKMGVSSVDDGSGNSGLAVTTDASRLGVKGSNDLGDGMEAIYQLETEVFPDASGAATFGRNTFVGIKAGWGKVRLGKFDTAYKSTTGKMDPFADTAADMTGSGFFADYDKRENNTVSYTNKFGALKLGVDAHLAELDSTATMGNSIGLQYNMGNFDIIAANTTRTNGDAATKIGLGMKFGGTKVNLISESQSDADNAGILGLNATLKVGEKGSVALAYNSNSVSEDTQMSLGYFNKMAKSTKVGVVYTTISGTSSGRLDKGVDMGAGTFTPNNPTAIQFVLHHNF
jgi:predicted porin